MSEIALIGMVHDPEGRYPALLERDLPPLMARCTELCAICGAGTAPRTVDALRSLGVEVVAGPDIPLNARPYALRLIAARPEWRHIHLTDLDHALHWVRDWPDELASVHRLIAAYDFLLLGRTARATATLPDFQRETERLINVMFAATTTGFEDWFGGAGPRPQGAGQQTNTCSTDVPMDICTGAWGLSQRAVAALVAHARIADVGFHAEWPLIVRDTPSLHAGYLPCEGLEYETAERYADAIAAAGGLDAWHAAQNADIARWRYRLAYVTQIADAIAAYRDQPKAARNQ
jgi:hypothetical protein